jgi:CRP/FNR family transcriptional regulator, cyclic AMP receptor protein
MRAVLDHCTGGRETSFPAGKQVICEGETTGRLYVLLDGKLDILKGGSVVASVTEPGSILGEMSALLGQPHTATVCAVSTSKVYEFEDAAAFLRSQPNVALLVAKVLAKRLSEATEYLAEIKRQYATLRGIMQRSQAH